jgi:hypothetical protein
VSLSPLAGILRTELIEAAGQRFSSLPSEAVTPLGTKDRTLCLTARPALLGARVHRHTGPASAVAVPRWNHAMRLM